MLRLCLCLLFALSSASAVAREVKMSSPNSGGCSGDYAAADKDDVSTTATRAPAPRDTKVKPSVRSDAPSRLSSPRFHSFLPGMFR